MNAECRMRKYEGAEREDERATPAALHPSSFCLRRYAAIFAGFPLATDATVVAPLPVVPKLTTNSATSPTAVDRVPWIWYETEATPDGTVRSTNFRSPDPPRYVYSPVASTLR